VSGSLITWGMPAQIADSKEGLKCGRCGAKRGIYGRDFGVGPDGSPLPVVESHAFDITISSHSIAALCWKCGFAYALSIKPKPEKRRKPRRRRRKRPPVRHKYMRNRPIFIKVKNFVDAQGYTIQQVQNVTYLQVKKLP